jgi:hypothetical protein
MPLRAGAPGCGPAAPGHRAEGELASWWRGPRASRGFYSSPASASGAIITSSKWMNPPTWFLTAASAFAYSPVTIAATCRQTTPNAHQHRVRRQPNPRLAGQQRGIAALARTSSLSASTDSSFRLPDPSKPPLPFAASYACNAVHRSVRVERTHVERKQIAWASRLVVADNAPPQAGPAQTQSRQPVSSWSCPSLTQRSE